MKIFLKIFLATFLWFNTATAESNLPLCQGEDYMYWSNCFGSYTNRDVTIEVLNNFPRMNELFPNSTYKENYKGEFGSKPGVKNGKGKKELFLNDEIYSTYEGKYFNDQRDGYGVYKNIKRNWDYKGNWKNDLRHGQGSYFSSKGNKYVGEWKEGQLEGQGNFTYSNGDKYIGKFKDGRRNGQGTIMFSNGNKYVGEWRNNKINGQGAYTFADGDKIIGEWIDGKKVDGKSELIETAANKKARSTWGGDVPDQYVTGKFYRIDERYSNKKKQAINKFNAAQHCYNWLSYTVRKNILRNFANAKNQLENAMNLEKIEGNLGYDESTSDRAYRTSIINTEEFLLQNC